MSVVETNVNFREHDVEFLQSRARTWLEAVLGERFDEQRTLADLIADGNLLYRVAKYVVKDMTGQSPGPELYSPKAFSEAAVHSKNSRKYLPYSNVDLFLKMCRKVGLHDVDLFTPPDAVEGKDIRRVCLCIRGLAKRARAQHIRVPDFDDVTRPLPMPTEKVGEIRESLQHSSSSPVPIPTVESPTSAIQQSERVQIIARFLSSTTNSPLNASETETPVNFASTPPPDPISSPATPGPTKGGYSSVSDAWNSPSTPVATLAGPNTPSLIKSASTAEPSPSVYFSSNNNFSPFPAQTKVPPSLQSTLEHTLSAAEGSVEKSSDTSEESSHAIQKKEGIESRVQEAPQRKEPEGHDEIPPSNPSKLEATKNANEAHPSNPSSRLDRTLVQQPKDGPPKAHRPQSKAPVAVVDKSGSKSTTKPASNETPATVSSRQPTTNGPSSKEPAAKPIQLNINLRLWMPVAAGAVAFLGTLLAIRSRDPVVYEVKQGDTLSKISKQVGRATWEELVKLNPSIKNPDLIYPSERLKLPV